MIRIVFEWFVFIVITFFREIDSDPWIISNSGKDSSNCSDEKNPCQTFGYAVNKASPGDTIKLMARYEHEHFKICEHGRSLNITKSLTITGYNFLPMIFCDDALSFTLLVNGTNRTVNIAFRDVAFKTNNFTTCTPSKNGVLSVTNANISISHCYFYNTCTALLVKFNNDRLYTVRIKSTEFTRVSYSMYSSEIQKAYIDIHSLNITGNKDFPSVASHAISLHSYSFLSLNIQDSAIKNTHEGISVTVHGGVSKIQVKSMILTENAGSSVILTFGRKAVQNKSSILIDNVQFVKNIGIFSSTIYLQNRDKENQMQVSVNNCIFYGNRATTFFGAIYANGVSLLISNSLFTNNVAGQLHGSIQGFGGAVYIETRTNVTVYNSTFINNTCSGFGGTIFSRGIFKCENCEFIGPSRIPIRPLLGDILYATAGLDLVNTSWKSTVMKEIPRSLIWHPGSPTVERWTINIGGYFKALCPEGHNISYSGVVREKNAVRRVAMTCTPCSPNEYSLNSGSLTVRQNDGIIYEYKRITTSCHRCKYGGTCSMGSIRPQSNYYGFRTGESDDEVRFISCPVGYCCKGTSCQKYDSCQEHREGDICGMCKRGTSENLINSDCVDPRECHDHWFWVLYFPAGILYILVFMYLDKVSAFIKQQLIWWDRRVLHRNDLTDYDVVDGSNSQLNGVSEELDGSTSEKDKDGSKTGNEFKGIEEDMQTTSDLDRDNDLDRDRLSGLRSGYIHRNDIFKKPGDVPRGSDIFTDLLNNSFYFFQMFLLIRMRESIVLEYIWTCLRSVYSSIFTLSVEGNAPILVCPIANLTSVTKLLFVKSFACYVLALLFFFHTVVYVTQYLLLQDLRRKEALIIFSIRLKVATIQVLLLAYATLSTTAVTLVTCVPMTNKKSVLLIDGTIRCYTWWQILIFVFVIGWVVPFPVTMVYSLVHLKNRLISYHQFVLAWAFPLPYIVWGVVYFNFCGFSAHSQERKKRIFEHENFDVEEKLSVEEILFRLECPFVGEALHRRDERRVSDQVRTHTYYVHEPAFWQGAMIGRRLILILVLTFVTAPVSKYYCALFLCVLYLIHQLYYRPYVIKMANMYETLTSSTLVLFCSMNLFFAYSYVSDLSPESADEQLSLIFRWFEAIILVCMPTVAVFCLFCLVLTRVIILIAKLFGGIFSCISNRRNADTE